MDEKETKWFVKMLEENEYTLEQVKRHIKALDNYKRMKNLPAEGEPVCAKCGSNRIYDYYKEAYTNKERSICLDCDNIFKNTCPSCSDKDEPKTVCPDKKYCALYHWSKGEMEYKCPMLVLDTVDGEEVTHLDGFCKEFDCVIERDSVRTRGEDSDDFWLKPVSYCDKEGNFTPRKSEKFSCLSRSEPDITKLTPEQVSEGYNTVPEDDGPELQNDMSIEEEERMLKLYGPLPEPDNGEPTTHEELCKRMQDQLDNRELMDEIEETVKIGHGLIKTESDNDVAVYETKEDHGYTATEPDNVPESEGLLDTVIIMRKEHHQLISDNSRLEKEREGDLEAMVRDKTAIAHLMAEVAELKRHEKLLMEDMNERRHRLIDKKLSDDATGEELMELEDIETVMDEVDMDGKQGRCLNAYHSVLTQLKDKAELMTENRQLRSDLKEAKELNANLMGSCNNKRTELEAFKILQSRNLVQYIVCPECNHTFSVSSEMKVKELSLRIGELEDDCCKAWSEVDNLRADLQEMERQRDELEKTLDGISFAL